MRRLSNFVYWVIDDGGFGQIVCVLLAVLFALGTVAEVSDNGLTGLAVVEGCLTVAMVVAVFVRD